MALIDRDVAIKTICEKEGCGETCDVKCLTIRAILKLPEVDAKPVVHGEWKKIPVEFGFDPDYECTNCRFDPDGNCTRFCPNCGADMRVTDNNVGGK